VAFVVTMVVATVAVGIEMLEGIAKAALRRPAK
jgi:hypothetical protein